MENYVLKGAYEEHMKRVDDENARQNHRISALENTVTQIANIMSSVERLATNMEHMAKEQQDQGERLKVLESQDGEMWRKITSYTITAVISIILGFLASKLGL
jgi:hypothetical protein